MFRSFIYLDKEKFYTYKRQIDGKNAAQPKAVSQKKISGFSAAMSGFGVNGATETSIDSEFEKDVSFDYDHFELDLSKLDGEDYFDCVLNDEYDLTTIPAMKILRICSGFEIPEAFDAVKAPICRLGCIARVADAFVTPQKTEAYLVDAQTFPGNSGGPIVSRPEHISIDGTPKNTSSNLIGILSAYIPYRETLYSRQTGRDRMVQEENSGLTIVHPVDRIKEVVEREWARVERQKVANNAEGLSTSQEAKEEVVV